MLGAYYYLWYGKPTPPILGMGEWKSGYSNRPVLGEYNSRDEKVISQHLSWVKGAGIDFFAIGWLGPGTWEDITLKDYYLSASKGSDIKFCIHYDSSFALNKFRLDKSKNQVSFDFQEEYLIGKNKGEKFLEDFDYLADNYFNHPQYLKIDGKPVVILYNASAFRNIEKYFAKIPSMFLVADSVCWSGVKVSKRNLKFFWENPPKEWLKVIFRAFRRLSPKSYEKDISLSKYFSAITNYNAYSPGRMDNFFENLDDLYQKYSQYARSQNLHFIPDIMPGYDDRKQNGLAKPVFGRKKGEFYRNYWETARKYLDKKLPIAMITTFNEWHEGTEIEPSKEYGDEYIKITKKEKESNL